MCLALQGTPSSVLNKVPDCAFTAFGCIVSHFENEKESHFVLGPVEEQVALKQGVAVEHSAHLLRLRGGGKAAAAVKAEPKAGRSVASVLHAIVNARTATAFVILGEPCPSLLCRSHLLKELRSPRFHPTQRPEARPLNAASLPRMAPVPLVTRRRLAHFRGLRPPTPALRQGRALLTRRASARRPVQPPCSRSSGRTRRRRTLPPPRHL